MKAAILTIGDELLNGHTIDTNAAWIGQELNLIGVSLSTKLSVADDATAIREGLDYCFSHAAIVLVTGGLGPTEDDITKSCLAEYFQDELVFHQPSYDRITSYFAAMNRTPTKAHQQQCHMPTKAELIPNHRGTAPGMWFAEDGRYLLGMPGVPSEMKGLMKNGGLNKIDAINTHQNIYHYVIQTASIGETYIAENIQHIVDTFPEDISIAYLPGIASVKLRVTAIGSDSEGLKSKVQRLGTQIVQTLGDHVYAIGDTSLQAVIGQIAIEKKWSIGTAESCTGGYIAQLIASIPGASAYYKGSIIAYDNDIKITQLDVPKQILEKEGAVSESTVQHMVQGLLQQLDVDLAIAVSGIAGPSGGTKEKPVGTIWIAVGNHNQIVTKRLQLSKTRELNIQYTSVYALNELRKLMLSL